MIVVSIAQASACNVLEMMLTSPNPANEFEAFGLTLNDTFKNIINNALTENGDGSLEAVIPSVDFSAA